MSEHTYPTPEEVAQTLEKTREDTVLPPEYFAFRIDLIRSEAGGDVPKIKVERPPGLNDEALAQRQVAGLTFLDPAALAINPADLGRRAAEVGEIFARHGMAFGPDLARMAIEGEGEAFLALGKLLLARDRKALDKEAKAMEVSVDLLAFFVAETLRPFLREAAASVRELSDDEKWRRGYCPVCGAEPSFSKFEGEGGARYLLCSVCETVWQFQRVKCPFCANADADTLGFFFHEETPRYRIDFCRDCNRYIKGVDLRETIAGTDVSLRSEDVKTLYLDLAAEKKGFVK